MAHAHMYNYGFPQTLSFTPITQNANFTNTRARKMHTFLLAVHARMCPHLCATFPIAVTNLETRGKWAVGPALFSFENFI